MIRRARRDGREARRNEEREKRIEKRSRERIIEKRERDKTKEGGPERPPLLWNFLDPTSWSSRIKIRFLQAYRI